MSVEFAWIWCCMSISRTHEDTYRCRRDLNADVVVFQFLQLFLFN